MRIWFVKQDYFYFQAFHFSCQDLFSKLAEATGETLESVCQMQEAERNGQLEVLGLKKEPRSLTYHSESMSYIQIYFFWFISALLGFEQAWTPILNLTAPLCKLLRSVIKLSKLGRLDILAVMRIDHSNDKFLPIWNGQWFPRSY